MVFIQLQNWKNLRPGVTEIAKEIEAPAAFTAKILHTLTTRRLLQSMKGRGGGFFFPDFQSNLSLYDLIMVMEGDSLFTRCGFGLKHCNDAHPCPVHKEYAVIRDSLLKLARSESVASLAEKIRTGQASLSDTYIYSEN